MSKIFQGITEVLDKDAARQVKNIIRQNPKGSAAEKMLLQRYIKTPMVQDFDLSAEEWIGQATKWLAVNQQNIKKNYPEVDTSDLIDLATKMYEDFLAMQGKLEETHSSGTTTGSAGIGGGVGLGIDKSPIEKVLEKPHGESVEEGLDRPKVLFNPKPMRKGPGDSPDDYEYTDYVPRGKEDKEAWAIKRTVAKQKLPAKKQKELDTGFYKNYLSNRPVREDDLKEANPNQQLALYNPSGTTYRGEHMPKMEPDPVDKAKPLSRAKNVPADLPDVDDEIRQKQLRKKLLDIIDNDPSFSPKHRYLIKAYYLDGKTFDQLAKELDVSPSRVNQLVKKAERFLRHPERAKQLRPFLLADGQIYSTGGGAGQSYRKFTPKAAGLEEEQAPMFTPEENLSELKHDTIDDYISRKSALARGGLPEPAKKFGNIKVPAWKVAAGKVAKPGSEMNKYAKVKATLEDEIVNANDPNSDGWKRTESAIMKGLQAEAEKVSEVEADSKRTITFSKENPPPGEMLVLALIKHLNDPNNRFTAEKLIDTWNKMYGLNHTLKTLASFARNNDFTRMQFQQALVKTMRL